MKKEKFNITGMTCSSCSSHVEKAVSKLKGIKNVNVNLLSKTMVVEYDENILNNDIIITTVKDAGYGASINLENLKDNKEIKYKDKDNETLKGMKTRVIISVCFLIPLMYLAMHHMLYEMFNIPIPKIILNIFSGTSNAIPFVFTQFLLLLPIIYVNRSYFSVGFKRLVKLSPNMDSLIAMGSTSAIIYGLFAIYMIGFGLGHNDFNLVQNYLADIYFESAGTILTLITFGKYLEEKSKNKTTKAIEKLINLVPDKVIAIRNNKEIEIYSKDVIVGDVLVIKPGSSIPVDGVIIDGTSTVDESSITGESIPVEKNINDNVVSGTINKSGYFKMKALKVGDDTTLAKIIKLVEEASNSKAPISKLADKVSLVFVPCVIVISLLAFIFWILYGKNFEFALSIGISVLVISCPCALGLATPVAIMVGTGVGAKRGILIKSAESLQQLSNIDTVVLDKTGTLTQGKPKVTDVISYIDKDKFLEIVGSLEKNSEHPLAEAINEKVKQKNISIITSKDFVSKPGRGVKAKINNKLYFGGNENYIKENHIIIDKNSQSTSEKLLLQGKTVLYFSDEKNIIGLIAVSDSIKSSSKDLIRLLKNNNIESVMITGDNKIVAKNIAKKLGIKKVISEVLPQQKQEEVIKLKLTKKVAFVGDGINDSPALASADVGIAIGSGTDIAIESADIVLMKDDLTSVFTAIKLSKATINNIKLNLFWAFIYNIIGIPIAAGVLYIPFGLKLNPMIGALAMSLSSVCVVTNALRLNNFKYKIKEENKMEEIKKIIYIDGMSCNHCKMSVEKALGAISQVKEVNVSLEKNNATIKLTENIDDDVIKSVIEEVGFSVKEIR